MTDPDREDEIARHIVVQGRGLLASQKGPGAPGNLDQHSAGVGFDDLWTLFDRTRRCGRRGNFTDACDPRLGWADRRLDDGGGAMPGAYPNGTG